MESRYGCIEAYLNHKVNPDTLKKAGFRKARRALDKLIAVDGREEVKE